MTTSTWYDLRPAWQATSFIARQHNEHKSTFRSTRAWCDGSAHKAHHYGLLGEVVYSLATCQAVDFGVRVDGDKGLDFPDGCDVKTSTYWLAPWLIMNPGPLRATLYALVALDTKNYRGRLTGWATEAMLQSASTRDWGHGPMISLPAASLLLERPQLTEASVA